MRLVRKGIEWLPPWSPEQKDEGEPKTMSGVRQSKANKLLLREPGPSLPYSQWVPSASIIPRALPLGHAEQCQKA